MARSGLVEFVPRSSGRWMALVGWLAELARDGCAVAVSSADPSLVTAVGSAGRFAVACASEESALLLVEEALEAAWA